MREAHVFTRTLVPRAALRYAPRAMVVTGVEIDKKIRAAKARLKGQRDGVQERQALHDLACWLGLRDLYRTTVHARFDLDETRQVSLAVAVAYAKLLRGRPTRKLWAQIHEAKRVRVDLPAGAG